jgi:hypothetical protein
LVASIRDDGPLPDGAIPGNKVTGTDRASLRPITEGVNTFDRVGWLGDGRLMYDVTEDRQETVYTMNADGKHVKQLTHELGYDGGPFWSADCPLERRFRDQNRCEQA